MPRSLIIFLGISLAVLFVSGCKTEGEVLPPVSSGNAPSSPDDEAPITNSHSAINPSVIVDADSAPLIQYSGNSN